jgi:hypothetical protein
MKLRFGPVSEMGGDPLVVIGPSRMRKVAIVCLGVLAGIDAEAATVTVQLNIPKVLVLQDDPDGLADNTAEVYVKGSIGTTFFQTDFISVPTLEEVFLDWVVSASIEAFDYFPLYDIPVRIELWDYDGDRFNPDDPLDIFPGDDLGLDFFYNLNSRGTSLVSPQEGTPPQWARIWFDVTSDNRGTLPIPIPASIALLLGGLGLLLGIKTIRW